MFKEPACRRLVCLKPPAPALRSCRSGLSMTLALTMAIVVLLPIALPGGSVRADAGHEPDPNGIEVTQNRASAEGCSGEAAAGYLICPEPDDASYSYIDSIASYPATDGIAVTFTESGLEHAVHCRGAAELATMIADLYDRLPPDERSEETIDWAIPRMTGEISGHARLYQATSSDVLKHAANPVNIVFPEYRGVFPEGTDGMNAWAQQVYYGSLCT
jgi:hypothetical protein